MDFLLTFFGSERPMFYALLAISVCSAVAISVFALLSCMDDKFIPVLVLVSIVFTLYNLHLWHVITPCGNDSDICANTDANRICVDEITDLPDGSYIYTFLNVE